MNKLRNRFITVCGTAMFLSLLVSSAWGYEQEIEQLSSQMAEKIAGKGKKTVAVVDFTDLQGNVTELGRFIAEELSGSLAKGEKGFEVVNRSNLRQLIKEYELFSTGAIDQKAAMKLGEFSGIEALIIGTITPFTENIRVSTSVLDMKTAKVIDNEREDIPRTKDIDDLLNKEIGTASLDGGTAQKTEAKSAPTKKDKGGNSGAFSDDFNAGPKPDWKPINGNWTMSNGQYTVTDINEKETYTTFIDGKMWNNFIVEIDVSPGNSNRFNSDLYDMNICPRMISSKEKVCFGMYGHFYRFDEAYWFVVKDGSSGEPTSRVSLETSDGKPVHVKIEVKDGVFTSYVNGVQTNQIYDATFSAGSVGLSQWYQRWAGEKIRIAFDNLEIKPLAD